MMDWLRRRLFGQRAQSIHVGAASEPLPGTRVVHGDAAIDLRDVATEHAGFLRPDWTAVFDWIDTLPEDRRAAAWLDCERAWLQQVRLALGPNYRLNESERAFLVSAQPANEAAATLRFLATTEARICRMLEEIADTNAFGKEILMIFEDQDDYYRYVGYFYPEEGEFAMSSGMFLNDGCGHFVLHGAELEHFEPVIVHEMTHSHVSHLPIPAWLNEGMAVNAEQRLTRRGADVWSVQELEAMHRRFWTPETIQEFWSGAAYLRPDEGSELAYDLGRLMVVGLSQQWPAFKAFALAAKLDDSGAQAAHEHLDVDLGEFVRHFLGQDPGQWAPDPARWPQAPERGQF